MESFTWLEQSWFTAMFVFCPIENSRLLVEVINERIPEVLLLLVAAVSSSEAVNLSTS